MHQQMWRLAIGSRKIALTALPHLCAPNSNYYRWIYASCALSIFTSCTSVSPYDRTRAAV